MTEVVDIRKADDPRDVIHRAVHCLARGELVAFPTETVYVIAAHALLADGVTKLRQTVNGLARPPHSLAVKGAQEALDYVPRMSYLGRKLSRRCWPGPVAIRFDIDNHSGLLQSLPQETQQAVVSEGTLQLRVPAHQVIQEVMRLMPAPLVISTEATNNGSVSTTAEAIRENYANDISLIIDDGSSRYGEPASTVEVTLNRWKLVNPGVVNESTLGRLACEIYLFVCTGNTCRSPLAEALFRKILAERLKCSEDELIDRGFMVESAGMAAMPGMPASPESVKVGTTHGVDLSRHESQPFTDRLLEQADRVYAMTRGHLETLVAMHPELSDQISLLARDGSDIPDPIGGGLDEYEKCEREIERHICTIVEELNV